MCPVCLKPNPRGREFCHHCWGARLEPTPVLTLAELEAASSVEVRPSYDFADALTAGEVA